MKKTLGIVFILLLWAVQVKGAGSQSAVDHPFNYLPPSNLLSEQSLSGSPSTGIGQDPYYTHPEFTGIMTTTVTVPAQNTDDGYIFVASLSQFYDGQAAVLILDNTGEPLYIKTVPDDHFVGDFRKQTVNGTDYLTYHTGDLPGNYTYGSSYVLNENYELVDTWTIDNGYGADVHEFLLLENGNALLMGYFPIPFDLSPYGGPVNGTLIDIIIQEQDAGKNVVFEWIGSEHMPIEDTIVNVNTTDPVDFLHTNAFAVDYDGHLLLSHRHFSEITKINRQTGDTIWRMGGAGNEFTFTNDIGFSQQHSINRLPNGNILLFDNGNGHTPPHSRGIEYIVDETAKTVTRYGMYPGDTSEFSTAMGNIQRLPNGNSFIGWGSQPKLTEVQTNGSVTLEMLLGSPSYRAFRFPWIGVPAAAPRSVVQYDVDPTAVTIYTSWNGATNITGYDVYVGQTIAGMTLVTNVPRSGFETEISLSELPPNSCLFRTRPIHDQGDPTPFSNLMFRTDLPECSELLEQSYLPGIIK